MKGYLVIILLIFIPFSDCIRDTREAWIKGEIKNPAYKMIRIGDNSVPFSENEEFCFNVKLKSPVFYEVSYNDMVWTF